MHRFPLSLHTRISLYERGITDGCWRSTAGISPLRWSTGPHSMPATPRCLITVVRSDYDYEGILPPLLIFAHKLPHLFCSLVSVALPHTVGPCHGLVTGSWRTGCLAPHRRGCIRFALCCTGIICRAFFFKVHRFCVERETHQKRIGLCWQNPKTCYNAVD